MTTITTKQELCTMIKELIELAPELTVQGLTQGTTNISEAVVQVLTIGANKLNKQRPSAWFKKYAGNFELTPKETRETIENYVTTRVTYNAEEFKNRMKDIPTDRLSALKLEVEKLVFMVIHHEEELHKTKRRLHWESIAILIENELESR